MEIKTKVLNFFISGNIAFNQADNPEFKRLMGLIQLENGSFKISRRLLRDFLFIKAKEARSDLKRLLMENDSKISLALDCWSSKATHAYLGIFTVAYISSTFILKTLFCTLQIKLLIFTSYHSTLD